MAAEILVPSEPSTVWEGSDAAFLRWGIPFYLRRAPTQILDATCGLGVFWDGASYLYPFRGDGWQAPVILLDNDPKKAMTILADNRALPFITECLDVIVYDPPHVTHGWSPWDSAGRYSVAQGRGSIGYLFPDFLQEARRCLSTDGVLMAKIADQIHSGRNWIQSVEYINAATDVGFQVCDLVVKVRSHYRPQPKGRRTLHARRRHSFWIICRKEGC